MANKRKAASTSTSSISSGLASSAPSISILKETWAKENGQLLNIWTQEKYADVFILKKWTVKILGLWYKHQHQQPLFFTSPYWMRQLVSIWISNWISKFPTPAFSVPYSEHVDNLKSFLQWLKSVSRLFVQNRSKDVWLMTAAELFGSNFFVTLRFDILERGFTNDEKQGIDLHLFLCLEELAQWIPALMMKTVHLWMMRHFRKLLMLPVMFDRTTTTIAILPPSQKQFLEMHQTMQRMFQPLATLDPRISVVYRSQWLKLGQFLFREFVESKFLTYLDLLVQDFKVAMEATPPSPIKFDLSEYGVLQEFIDADKFKNPIASAYQTIVDAIYARLPKITISCLVEELFYWNLSLSEIPWFDHLLPNTLEHWLNHPELCPTSFAQELDRCLLFSKSEQQKHLGFQSIDIFNRLHDQESYNNLYQELTCQRFLGLYEQEIGTGVKIDTRNIVRMENNIAEAMSKTCDPQWITHYKTIIQEFENRHIECFKEDESQNYRLMVASRSAWKFSKSKIHNNNNSDWIHSHPQILFAIDDMNSKYLKYNENHNRSRTLTWCLDAGQAVVAIHFNKKPLYFQVNTMAMVLLMQFDQQPMLTLAQLMDRLKLPSSIFRCELFNLCVERILLVRPSSALQKDQKDPQNRFRISTMHENMAFKLNSNYSSKFASSSLNLCSKPFLIPTRPPSAFSFQQDDKQDKIKTQETQELDLERNMRIQTTLARIMKAKKTMLWKELVAACKEEFIQKRRTPITQQQIARQIDDLIDRLYFERDRENRQEIRYVP